MKELLIHSWLMLNSNSKRIMDRVIELSETNLKNGKIPIAAVIVDKKNYEIISESQNEDSPIGHAELLAITKALKKLNTNRLDSTHLFVTIEPCPMCAYAISKCHINRLYFGSEDEKGGGVINGPRIFESHNLKKIDYVSHCYHEKTTQLMQSFFQLKRNQQL